MKSGCHLQMEQWLNGQLVRTEAWEMLSHHNDAGELTLLTSSPARKGDRKW